MRTLKKKFVATKEKFLHILWGFPGHHGAQYKERLKYTHGQGDFIIMKGKEY